MKKLLFTMIVFIVGIGTVRGDLMLPDGTVTANGQDSSTGVSAWWGEAVTTLTIDAQNIPSGYSIEISGKITGISNTETSWVEIGLIPKTTWDYWQTAYGGNYQAAVFNKGIYIVDWSSGGLGLSLDENGIGGGPFAWPLSSPTSSDPWEFTISMYPTTSGNAYLSVPGEDMYGTQPFAYSSDYSESYLIAQIWSGTEGASFSFEDVKASVVPIPGAVILGILGLGAAGIKLRKYA